MSKPLHRKAKRELLDRINSSIIHANNGKRSKFGIATKTCNRKSVNRAVAIARNPGPDMNFVAHELDYLLIEAGFNVKSNRRNKVSTDK